jgi:DNA adenine methylase
MSKLSLSSSIVHEGLTVTPQADPFIKWAGGKRQLVPQLLEHAPKKFKAYREPFVGAGAFFLALQNRDLIKGECIISDSLPVLMTTWEMMQNKTQALIRELKRLKDEYVATPDEERQSFYYRQVTRLNSREKPLQGIGLAACFIFLNKTGFNGLFRLNQKRGDYNVPFGHHAKPSTIFDSDNLLACRYALRNARVWTCDYQEHIPERGDFVYCDPPYYPREKGGFVGYTEKPFGIPQQKELAEWATKQVKKGVKIMLSNHDLPEVRNLYSPNVFTFHRLEANRSINSDGRGRGAVYELLIKGY